MLFQDKIFNFVVPFVRQMRDYILKSCTFCISFLMKPKV